MPPLISFNITTRFESPPTNFFEGGEEGSHWCCMAAYNVSRVETFFSPKELNLFYFIFCCRFEYLWSQVYCNKKLCFLLHSLLEMLFHGYSYDQSDISQLTLRNFLWKQLWILEKRTYILLFWTAEYFVHGAQAKSNSIKFFQ
jgi:hypothetical protein